MEVDLLLFSSTKIMPRKLFRKEIEKLSELGKYHGWTRYLLLALIAGTNIIMLISFKEEFFDPVFKGGQIVPKGSTHTI